MGKIRGTHSSPGVYTQITDLSYAAKTLGITSLGLVGETEKGPAFEPIEVHNWNEFYARFGGTNPEQFKDSQYPKYELPYIAKSYLDASDKLHVCRVLGLSGYNAGPAWVIKATREKKPTETSAPTTAIAVLRSRGKYRKYGSAGTCGAASNYDQLEFECTKVEIAYYATLGVTYSCDSMSAAQATLDNNYNIDTLNYGRFALKCYSSDNNLIATYSVSLNPGAKDYIYNVLGGSPTDGEAAIYVEELYDILLEQGIYDGSFTKIDSTITKVDEVELNVIAEPVLDFVKIPEKELKRKNLGQSFVFAKTEFPAEGVVTSTTYHNYDRDWKQIVTGESATSAMVEGCAYTVASIVENNVKKYVYAPLTYVKTTGEGQTATTATTAVKLSVVTNNKVDTFYNLKYDAYMMLVTATTNNDTTSAVTFLADWNDYHEGFRCASTPWIVSELKGDSKKAQVKKLFRFHTISDGNNANEEVKISIANIRPDDGTFDVLIRDYNDSDANPTILESYRGLSMVPGTNNYIGLRIGTLDGKYELKSNYVMVEVIENEMTKTCVPAGFLGYPVRHNANFDSPRFEYNRLYDDDIKDKRQYFGLSDLKGVDIDILRYKGKNAYTENYTVGYTNGFHLDSTLSSEVMSKLNATPGSFVVTVDGDDDTSGLTWDAVSPNNVTAEHKAPIIASEQEMEGTIYENVNLRKFTVYPYGGFDGWDIYRRARTNTDEFKANRYKGTITNGYGKTFSKIMNTEDLALTGNCITSDYYAYLAGINQFADPEKVEINLFATPGIDYINHALLSEDAFDMVENRLDSVYVVTTPDKPWGAKDENTSDAYTSSEAADNLEDTNVDTYYGTTFYPWVKFFDKQHNVYINLPATKDALRDMADVDNKKYPWTASAGLERGKVECTKLHVPAKLEDRDNVYDNRINPLMSFPEGVRIWGNKTLYKCDETNPMSRLNTVRLVLYLRKLIVAASLPFIFEADDPTTKDAFEGTVKDILTQVKSDRGITDFRLDISQTKEQMDLHEMSGKIWVKPTPVLEYIELDFVVTPQGIEFDEIA